MSIEIFSSTHRARECLQPPEGAHGGSVSGWGGGRLPYLMTSPQRPVGLLFCDGTTEVLLMSVGDRRRSVRAGQ